MMSVPQSTEIPLRPHYRGLDSLRGIAIILVILYHNFNFLPLAEFGFIGVDLFFVLSGFLITDILLRTKNHANYFYSFYIRRILRIFPVYFGTLIFFIYVLPVFAKVSYDVNYYRTNQYWFYLFIQNWLFIQKPLENTYLLNHFWSLAIEEQFYLVWPLIIYTTKNTKILVPWLLGLLVTVFIIRWVLLMMHVHDPRIYTFLRFDGLLAGCFVSLIQWHRIAAPKHIYKTILSLLTLLTVAFFVCIIFLKKNIPFFPFWGFTAFTLLFGMGVHYILNNSATLDIISLPRTFTRFLGKISYSLYIFHWPIFVLLSPVLRQWFAIEWHFTTTTSQFTSALITTTFAIMMSYCSYRYFELYFLRQKKYFTA